MPLSALLSTTKKKILMTRLLSVIALVFAVTTFAPTAHATEISDPLEGINRKIDAFNTGVDLVIFRPLAKGYEFITPKFVRQGVTNFFSNLFYPTTIVNQALQGNFKLAGQDFGRFVINTTIGIGGLFDPATAGSDSLQKHDEDFGQTFGKWGMSSGPYLVLPIFGPSNVRDGLGRLAGLFTNPITYVEDDETQLALFAGALIDSRYRLFKAEELISGDKYLFIRDAYTQRREHMIRNGAAEEHDPFLDD